jgi:thiol-disulfide isomerase/thioredoxin
MTNQQAVTSLPVPLGPYPEPVLALTLAGVDPAISLLGGMKSVKVIDRENFGEETPAVHLRGVQSDQVTWDLWIATDETPRPLRLAVDLTPMLAVSDQVRIPEGYTYQLRFDFPAWRVTGEVDESLFTYKPPKDAKEYASIEEYYQSIAGVMGDHPLLGKEIPEFQAKTLSGEPINVESFRGKVVVLDFWATWCAPCVASLPTIKQVTDEYADKDVVFYAVNTGEQAGEVEQFLKQNELELKVILDPQGEVASTFVAEAIPQTLIVGKDGVVESTHIGFVGEDALRQRLKDELDVLTLGGKIASAQSASESKDDGETKVNRDEEQP